MSNDNIVISTDYYEKFDCYTYTIKLCKSIFELNEKEKNILDIVAESFENYSTKDIVEYMHKEKAYIDTNDNEIISYKYAKTLSLSFNK